MHEGIDKPLRPTQSKTTSLKFSNGEVITDMGKQMERFLEHHSELYSRENSVATSTLHVIKLQPVLEEFSKACGKVPGNDGIPKDLIKRCSRYTTPSASTSGRAASRKICKMPRSSPCI